MTAIPSAIVSADSAGIGVARRERSRVRRAGGDLHADDLDLGPRRLDRDRDAGGEPAAADRDDDLGEVGHVLEQLQPERALAGDDVAGRRTGGRTPGPPSRARSCAAARHSSSDAPPTCTVAPCPRAASALAIGASAGTNTSHGTPRAAAAAASPWAWLPAEAATTPCAQPASPSAASLAAAPRTLNEPVRWRFSAFSTHGAAGALGDRARRQHRRAPGDALDLRRGAACDVGGGDGCQSGTARIASISTSAPSGSEATPIVLRAGGASPK